MKPNINDLSKFVELKAALVEKGVSPTTIETLNQALNGGLVVRKSADLGLLSIPAAEVALVAATASFGASRPEPTDLKTIQFTFQPKDTTDPPPALSTSIDAFFFGYQFVLGYTNTEQHTVEESYPIEAAKTVVVDIDLSQVLDRSDIIYRVKAPDGGFALVSASGSPSLDAIRLKKADVKVAESITVAVERTVVEFDSKTGSYQVKGRVLSDNNEEKMEGYQILIAASVVKPDDGPHEYLPIAYAKTETGGYFVTSFLLFQDPNDLDRVTDAKALVAKDDFQAEFPIKLVIGKKTILNSDHTPVEIDTSRIPARLIIMIDLESAAKDEKNGCGCSELNFHEKKVFEEFNYQTVVRTTEPAIIADVIEEEDEIDLGDIYGEAFSGKRVPRKVFTRFHQLKSRQPFSRSMGSVIPDLQATSGATLMRAAPAAARSDDPVLTNFVRRPFTEFDAQLLDNLIIEDRADQAVLPPNRPRVNKGRAHLTPLNQINWDKATIYQAASIAHGHLLHFKQEWIPDGYSIGDLLYSLPLAPGQKKQIAVLDWERRESAANSQSLDYEESLNNTLIRDRDISEVVSATLNENIRGKSTAKTSGIGFGWGSAAMGVFQGGTYGGVMGVSGGMSKAGSTASQTSHRDSTANSLQSIRDRTTQAASAVRSQRSTVIQTVSQGERVQATSESIANYNHCHAITIQYFEVVRHFAIHNRFVDAQECLFVPLQIANFDLEKVLRWRSTLERCVFKRELVPGFEALERIQNERESTTDDYYGSIGYPVKNFAEQQIISFQGELFMEFYFFNPKNPVENDLIEFFMKFFRLDLKEYHDRNLSNDELARLVGPRTIEFLLDAIVIETETGQSLNVDVTLVTPFRQNARLQISLRQAGPVSIAREAINGIRVRIDEAKVRAEDATDIKLFLDKYMKILVRSGSIRYRTRNFAGSLFNTRIDNDLFVGLDSVFIPTPLNSEELRNPRGEDIDAANNLIHHLNENLEYYHKCIWFHMSDERRYMLLDGIVAPGKANGRSVASVVENRIIGVAGNSLIMPVAPGFQLDPTVNSEDPVDLKAMYFEEDSEPMRISLPTKGVYAEAVIGKCNSCEEKDESKFWRWEESPIPDSPNTMINPIDMSTRRSDPGDLQPQDFPNPVVNIQNAPNVPDPTGLGAMLQLIGKGDSFRDITGLSENQKNALAAFQKSMDTAQAFGKEASELAKTAGMMEMLKKAKDDGVISDEKAKEKGEKILDQAQADPKVSKLEKSLEMIDKLQNDGSIALPAAEQLKTDLLKNFVDGDAGSLPSSTLGKLIDSAGKNRADVKVDEDGFSIEPKTLLAQLGNQPLQTWTGFSSVTGVISESDLRDGIRLEAISEHRNWFDTTGSVLQEDDDSQFGLLIFYWLSAFGAILPTTLSTMQALAISGGINFGNLLNDATPIASLTGEIRRVRNELLAAALDGTRPATLSSLVDEAILGAVRSHRDIVPGGPWSAVFVVSVIRRVAIQLGLEAFENSQHIGRDDLLRASSAHRVYIIEAIRRRFGPGARTGTYHAFRPSERLPQIGDIIAQDRRNVNVNGVPAFNNIPAVFAGGGETHCDIITEVNDDHVVAIGANLTHSVRRRQYPLEATGHLVVNRPQLYSQEDDNGNLAVPGVDNVAAPALPLFSTARIMALLSPIQVTNAVIPGQQVNGGVIT